ncbi:MAG: patatin-like phospholipase family protein [Salinisphaeraceae bacterium]|nr:patatin-like phospholipase family protein [Salinisphaeraceae bacterium]
MDISAVLKGCALFADLDQRTISALAKSARKVEVRSGEAVYHRGEDGDALYVVANGRLSVNRPEGPDHQEERVAELGRFEVVGEISVLTGESRSMTVRAVRDSGLVCIRKEAFEALLFKQPQSMLRVVQHIVKRLRRPRSGRKRDAVTSTRTIAVVAAHEGLEISHFCRELADELVRFGSVLRLDAQRVDDALGQGYSATVFEETERNQALYTWLNALEGQYRYVVYQAQPEPSAWSRRCLRQADRVLLLVDGNREAEDSAMLRTMRDSRVRAPVEVVQLHQCFVEDEAQREEAIVSPLDWRALCRSRFHHHVGGYPTSTMRRLARMVTGNGLGMVFSGGGARGLAHLGVIRALEERNLPIDLVGGTSMGALIASLCAVGYRFDDMMEILRETFVEDNYLNDYSLSRISLIRGQKLLRRLEDLLGMVEIQDLPVPFFCVTTNLTEGQEVVHDRGRLSHWVGASMSVPGIAPPFVFQGDLLVDGGLTNNLPADVMGNIGRGPIVASDVTPSREMRLEEEGDQELPYQLIRSRGDEHNLNMFNIMFQSATMTGEEVVVRHRNFADVLLRIPVDDVGMFAWDNFDEVVFRGYHYASEILDQALADGRLDKCVEATVAEADEEPKAPEAVA